MSEVWAVFYVYNLDGQCELIEIYATSALADDWVRARKHPDSYKVERWKVKETL